MATVRLDLRTETALKRLSVRLRPFIGIGDSGGRQLSEKSVQQFRELLEERQRARRSG